MHVPIVPVKKLHAQLFLEICNGLAQTRLRNVQLLRCPGKMLQTRNSLKITKLAQFHEIAS